MFKYTITLKLGTRQKAFCPDDYWLAPESGTETPMSSNSKFGVRWSFPEVMNTGYSYI
jgi:hypothetical protein